MFICCDISDNRDVALCMGNRMARVKLRINITCFFRNCRSCPSRAALYASRATTRAISAISGNTSDINP